MVRFAVSKKPQRKGRGEITTGAVPSIGIYNYRRDGITQGLLNRFARCRRLTYYWMHGWESPGVTPEGLLWGQLWHDTADLVYRKITDRGVWREKEPWEPKRIDKELVGPAINKVAKRIRARELTKMTPTEQRYLEGYIAGVSAMMTYYLQLWWEEDASRRWLYMEKTFKIPYATCLATRGQPDTYLRGKYDAVYTQGPRIYLKEMKTKGRISTGLAETLAYNTQLGLYSHCLSIMRETHKYLRGKRVSGAMYDIVRRPRIKVRNDESPVEFQVRLMEDVKRRPEFYYIRWPVPLQESRMEEFLNDLRQQIDEFVCWYMNVVDDGIEAAYRESSACLNPGTCKFIPICGNDAVTPKMLGLKVRDHVFPELEL